MAKEIERKFLVDLSLLDLPKGIRIVQGYIPTQGKTVVRVRIKGEQAFLTIKGQNQGAVRSEFEYAVPLDDANQMIDELCEKPLIDKTRYNIPYGDHLWELDIFAGENTGLVVAEVEMSSEDETVDLPEWVTQEVTGDAKYYNSNLLSNPYSNW